LACIEPEIAVVRQVVVRVFRGFLDLPTSTGMATQMIEAKNWATKTIIQDSPRAISKIVAPAIRRIEISLQTIIRWRRRSRS